MNVYLYLFIFCRFFVGADITIPMYGEMICNDDGNRFYWWNPDVYGMDFQDNARVTGITLFNGQDVTGWYCYIALDVSIYYFLKFHRVFILFVYFFFFNFLLFSNPFMFSAIFLELNVLHN
jgi:hypothetical protein